MKTDQFFDTDHLNPDIKRIAVRGGAITSIAQVIKQLLTMVSTVILARILTPQDYGLVAMVTAVTGFVALFKDMGLSMATIQRPEINHEQVSTLFWLNILISIVVCLITMGLAPPISWYYHEPRLVKITIILACGFLFGGLTIQHQALLRRQMRFKALVTMGIVSMALGILAAIIVALMGYGYWALVALHLGTQIVTALCAWILCPWKPGRPGSIRKVADMLKFGGNLTGFSIINYFSRNLDNFLIGRYYGAQQLGLYAKAYGLLLLPITQVNAPIQSVAVPTLSRLINEPERYRHAYLRILEKLTLIAMPLVSFFIVTSDWVIYVLLGPQWSGAAAIFSFLGIAGLVQPVANTSGWLFITQNRAHHQLRWGFVSGFLSILAIVAGLPWGAIGVAASYSISGFFLRTPLLLWYIGREGPVRTKDFYRACIPAGIASVAIAGSLILLRQLSIISNPYAGLGISLVSSAIIGFVSLLMFPSGRNALRDVSSLLPLFRSSA
jgi:PST family polysaccharide transporter